MTEAKRSLKVFLCHAHADRDPVRGLYTRLTQDGVDAWLDKAKLLPGQDWELEIRKAVREADVVVVCLSKQFNQAGFRQKEVKWALDTAMEKPEGEIFIIPARLEECDTLESLRKWHWVDLFAKDGYKNLLRSLDVRADKIGAKNIYFKKEKSNTSKKILLLDDDYESMYKFKTHLEEEMNWDVELSAEEELLERLGRERFDLIVLDLMIRPRSIDMYGEESQNIHYENVKWDRTGLEFLHRIRKGEYNGEKSQGTPSNVPIIVLSAVVDSAADSEWGKTLQNERYLEKPFNMSDLQNLIIDLLPE